MKHECHNINNAKFTVTSEASTAIMEDSSIDNCESNTLGNLTGISSLDTSLYKAGMSSLRLVSFSFWCSVKGRRFLLAGDIFTKSEEFSSSRVPRPKRLFVAEGFFVAEDGFKNLGDSFCFKRSRKLLPRGLHRPSPVRLRWTLVEWRRRRRRR